MFADLYDLNPASCASDAYLGVWKPDWESRYGEATAAEEGAAPAPHGQRKVSILRVITSSFGWIWLGATVLEMMGLVLQQIPPKFQSLLIHHVENPEEEDWKGYLYVIGLFVVNMLATVINNQHTFYKVVWGGRIYTSLVCAIYDKALLLSPTARKERTGADIT